MFGMGMPEILLILAIALIVIGPKKLPDLAKSMGRAMNEFRRATSELKESMEIDYDIKEVKKTFDDIENEIKKPIDISPGKNEDKISGDIKIEQKKSSDQSLSSEKKENEKKPERTELSAKKYEPEIPATDIPAELFDPDEDLSRDDYGEPESGTNPDKSLKRDSDDKR